LKKIIFHIVLLILFSIALYAVSPDNDQLFEEDQLLPLDSISGLYSVVKNNLPQNNSKAHEIAKLMNEQSLMINNDSLIAKSYFALGLVYYYKYYYRVSSRYYQEALKSDHAQENDLFRLQIENNLGINYDLLKDYRNALLYYNKSLETAKKLGDSTEIYELFINIGLAYCNLDSLNKALSMTEIALDYFKKVEDMNNVALCYQNLSKYQFELKNMNKAKELTLSSLEIYKKEKNDYMTARTYHNYALLLNGTKEFQKSNLYIDTALSILKDFNSPYLEAQFLLTKGENLNDLGFYKKSEEILKSIIPKLMEHEDFYRAKMSYLSLLILYRNWNKRAEHDALTFAFDSLTYSLNKKELEKVIEENMILNEIDVSFEALEHQKEMIDQKNAALHIRTFFIIILAIGIITILLLYKNLRKSYKDLFYKNVNENLTKPDICPAVNNDDKDKELYQDIMIQLKDEKVFKEPTLSLAILADKLNTNEKYISQAINKYSNSNFNTFINKYRVEEAKSCLLSKDLEHYSLEKIAELSGFNNRVTFSRVFKNFTKMTPSTFRKMSDKN
jgi:AraC-like DNA-binding protein